MDSEALKLKIDSSQARQDLDALARSLDRASKAAGSMQSNLAKGVDKSNDALVRGAKNIEKFARVTAELSKVKLSGDPAKQLTEFANAVSAVARAREISAAKLTGLSKFVQVGAQISKLKFSAESFSGLRAFTQAMDEAGRARAVSGAKLKAWVDFIDVSARASRLRFPSQTTSSIKALAEAMDAIAKVRTLSPSRLASIKEMFTVLASAKGINGANGIARDLDAIAGAATRAAKAMNELKGARSGMGGARGSGGGSGGISAGSAATVKRFNEEVAKTSQHTATAKKGLTGLGEGLTGLSGRFNLAYQAGTLFSAMFSSFTFGGLIKGIYDTSVSFQKLNKAMLFVTGTYDGAKKASQDFIDISVQLGASVEDNADAYSRFAISSAAAGLKLNDVNKIYKSTQLALTAVGANSEQVGYAFYGLSQAMAKGKISSEEFNRQIGEQIPGNAQAGARALSKLTGQQKSVADLFDEMRKGTLQSAPFLKAWADEVSRMFAPLLPEAEKRPDFQLNKVKTAFSLWKKEVGQSQFIGALTTQFKRLSDMLIVVKGDHYVLTDRGKKLADSFGKGLAQAVNILGNALAWLADNMDKVVSVIKVIGALAIGNEFAKWGSQVAKFADNMLGVKKAIEEVSAAESTAQAKRAVVNKSGAVNTAASLATDRMAMATNRSRDAVMGGTFVGSAAAPAVRQAPAFSQLSYLTGAPTEAARGRATFGQRQPFTGNSTFDARPAARGNMLGGLMGAASAGAATAATTAFSGLRKVINLLPGVALTAAVALAIFGNSMTKLNDKAVSYNNIAAGALGTAGDQVGMGLTGLFNGIRGLLGAQQKAAGTGDWLVDISASLIVFGKTIFTLASTLGKILGTMMSNIIIPWIDLGQKLSSGDLKGAAAASGEILLGQFGKESRKRWGDLGKELGQDWGKALDYAGTRKSIVDGALKSAAGDTAATQGANAAQKMTEAALAQMKAADDQALAAADLKDATANFKKDLAPLNFNDLFKRAQALADGTFQRTAAASKPGSALMAPSPAQTQANAAAVKATIASMGDRVYATAGQHMGQTAAKDGASLQAYFKANGVTIDPKKLSWCAAFVNAVLAQNGLSGTGSLAASSFKDYGSEVSRADAKKGDIVVLKPQDKLKRTTGHVGFLDGFNSDGSVRLLGGNQGGGVKVSNFKADQVVSFRRTGTGGASGADPSFLGGAIKDGQGEEGGSRYERRMNAFKALGTITGQSSPAADALSDYQGNLEKLRDIIVSEEKLMTDVGSDGQSFFNKTNLEALAATQKKWNRSIVEALNPIAKEARLLSEGNDVLELRAKGLSQEADWQERLTNMRNDGLNVDLMQDEAKWTQYLNELKKQGLEIDVKALMMKPDELRYQQGRQEALQTELDLTKALNDAKQAQIARTGSSYDRTLSGLIAGKGKEGESLTQTQDRLAGSVGPNGRNALEALQETAGVMESSRLADAKASMQSQLQIMRESARLNNTQRGVYEEYRNILGELLNKQGASLKELLDSADEQTKQLAQSFVKAKQDFENPPGFQKWADALEPLDKRLQDIKSQFMDDLGGGITDALLGEDVDWREMLHNTFKKQLRAQVDEGLKNVTYWLTGQDPNAQAAAKTPEAQALVSAADVQKQAGDTLQQAANSLLQVAQGGVPGAPGMMPGAQGPMGPMSTAVQPGMTPMQGLAAQGINSAVQGVGSLIGGDPTQHTGARSFGQRVGGILSSVGSMFGFGGNRGTAIAPGGLGAIGQTKTSGGLLGVLGAMNGVTGLQKTSTMVGGTSAAGGSTAISDALTMGGDLSRNAGMTNAMQIGSATISIGNATINGGGAGGGGGAPGGAPGAGGMGAMGGGGLGGLLGNLNTSTVGVGDNMLSQFTMDGSGGPGFMPAGSGLMNLFGGGDGGFGGGADLSGLTNNAVGLPDMLSAFTMDGSGGPGFQAAGSALQGLNITPFGGGGGLGGFFSAIGPMMQGAMSFAGPLIGALMTGGKKRNNAPDTYRTPNGVFGQASQNTVTGRLLGPRKNVFGEIANLAMQFFTGGMGGGGPMSMMSMFGGGGGMGGFPGFKEGGYTNAPVNHYSTASLFSGAPHYAEGTPNTSLANGGMPAIVHPDEAVIPLSRGRNIPVELNGAGGGHSTTVISPITVYANDADSFRPAQAQIARKQNKTLRRAALRNATMAA
ncbi:tail length tape measure protein [Caulobacter phage CcrRogue]|uniref:Putative tail tape measure protein n=1 Tax=Caulobacter phage CcrRogue TaxID=2927986 RepID=K4JNJ2_9CAUD|nr:tail length tape measure protein [Caulobacter phage CcrRogue]AFU86576.1 putative tail tape measure protein [Caulobacter phage CcrRogue]